MFSADEVAVEEGREAGLKGVSDRRSLKLDTSGSVVMAVSEECWKIRLFDCCEGRVDTTFSCLNGVLGTMLACSMLTGRDG